MTATAVAYNGVLVRGCHRGDVRVFSVYLDLLYRLILVELNAIFSGMYVGVAYVEHGRIGGDTLVCLVFLPVFLMTLLVSTLGPFVGLDVASGADDGADGRGPDDFRRRETAGVLRTPQ